MQRYQFFSLEPLTEKMFHFQLEEPPGSNIHVVKTPPDPHYPTPTRPLLRKDSRNAKETDPITDTIQHNIAHDPQMSLVFAL